MARALLLLLAALLAGAAAAKVAPPAAENPALEKRVMAVAAELRCLVCQNQSIAESDADLAKDLRQQIREKLQLGQSEADIMAYMVARYGDFVLWRPPFKGRTLVLWLGPLLLVAIALIGLFFRLARERKTSEVELSSTDQARAALLLEAGREPHGEPFARGRMSPPAR